MNHQLKIAMSLGLGVLFLVLLPLNGIAQESANVDPIEKLTKDREKKMVRAIYDSSKTAKTAGDFTKFIDACREALKKKISDKNRDYLTSLEAWGHYRRGLCRCEIGKLLREARSAEQAKGVFDEANKDFEISLEMDPTKWKPTLGIGLVKAERGDYLGAIETFTILCESKPAETVGWFNRAELYYQLERYSKALSDYNQVLEIEPADLQAMTGRAHCHYRSGEFEAARKDYEAVATMMPESEMALINLGDAHQALGQWKLAYESYFASMSIKATAAGSQKSAWLMATCPDGEQFKPGLALQLAEKAIELGGETRTNLDTLAVAQAANGEFEQAKETQKLAMAKLPQPESGQKNRMAIFEKEERFVQGASTSVAELSNPLKPKSSIRE